MPGPRTISDILGAPAAPRPAAAPAGRTIQDIISTPAPSPATPRPGRSIQDILGAPGVPAARPAAPRFEMPPELPANYRPPAVELPRPSWEPEPQPPPAPRPTQSPVRQMLAAMKPKAAKAKPARQPFVGPVQQAPRGRAERAARETEGIEREGAWSNIGTGPIRSANPFPRFTERGLESNLMAPVEALSDILARPVRAAGQVLAHAQEVGSRALAPVVNSPLGDVFAKGLQGTANVVQTPEFHQAMNEYSSTAPERLSPEGVSMENWRQVRQKYPLLAEQQQLKLARQLEAGSQAEAEQARNATLQGEDILGPRSLDRLQNTPLGQAISRGEEAGRARVEAQPDQNWAQQLTALLGKKDTPGYYPFLPVPRYMFDPKAEMMSEAALRRNPDAPLGAAALELLAPNPLAVIPGAQLSKLDKLGKLGKAMRLGVNLTGAGTGVGSDLPVQLAELAGRGLMKGVEKVGQVAERLGEGEGLLAKLSRVASLPASEARASEVASLLRNLRPEVRPRQAEAPLAPDGVDKIEQLGDNLAANRQGNLQAQRGMPRLADAERQLEPPAPARAPEPEPAPRVAEQPPAPAPGSVEEGLPPGVFRETVDPRTIQVDAKAYQFKSGGDIEGVTERLRDVQRWDASKAGTAIIHERLNGERFVADGHQRTGLARRLAENGQNANLNTLVYREADGFSVEDMRVIAASVNLAQDSGSSVDAAKVIRAYGEGSPHLADIPRSSVKFRDGRQLAKLGDEAFEAVVNEVVPAEFAAHVGRLIADPAEQAGAMRALARIEPTNSAQALSIVQDIRAQGMATRTEQGGLFGAEHFAEDLLGERAKIFAAAERLAKDDKALFAKIVRGEGNLEGAGNVLAKGANRERVTDAERLLAGLEEAKYRGPVNDRLNQLARELKSGGTNPTAAARSFLETVRGESELAGAARAVPGVTPEDAGGVASRLEPEPVPDIEGQESLFLDSAPAGASARAARPPAADQALDSTPAQNPAPLAPTPAPAPAAPPVDPKRPFWSKLFNGPRQQRVKSRMVLAQELRDTLGMVARGEHAAPATMFEKLQNTLQGNTAPRVTYGPLAPKKPGGGASRGATGRYHMQRDLIEMKDPGSSGTLYHEAGHAIDTHTEFVTNAPPAIRSELEQLGDPATNIPRTDGQSSWRQGMSKMRKRQEGMAEFLRLWMAHPDFDLATAYPELSKAWDEFLTDSNDVGRRLRRHQADMRVRVRSSDQALVRAQIVEENPTNALGVNDVLASGFDRYRWMQVMDSTLAANAGRALTPDESVYVTTRMLAGLDNVMGSWIRGAPVGFNREAVAGVKSLEDIFSPLEQSPDKFLDFRDYLVTRRADELHGREMKSGMDEAGVQRVKAELEQANPEFAAMADEVYKWNDAILQYAQDAGFLSQSALKSIRELNQNYVPFHRVYELASQEMGLPKGTGGGLQASERIRAIKGSMREIVDPIETMMANAAAMISAAEKNRVGQVLLQHWDEASEGIGHFIREVSEPQRLVTANPEDVIGLRQMKEALEGAGIPTDGIDPEQLADLVELLPQIKIFEKSGQLPENTVKVKVQVPMKTLDPVTGVESTTTVDRWRMVEMKPELYKAFTAMDEDQIHWAVNAMSGVANMLRAGATKYSPVFIVNNAVRDSIEASTVSRLGTRTKGKLRPFEPLVHAAHGLRIVVGSALAQALEKGVTGALEDASHFVGLGGEVPAAVRSVTDKMRMPAPAALKRMDELMTDFIRQGGMQGMDEMLASEAGTRAAYNRVFGQMNPKGRLLTFFPSYARPYIQGAVDLATLPIRTPAAIIRHLSETSEQMTRVSEFEKGLKVIAEQNPTWTEAQVRRQAAFEARDLLDFSMRGSQLRAFRRMVPFLGSQMTGNYRVAQNLLQGISEGKGWGSLGSTATRMFSQAAASITLPTLMLYAMNYKDADYNQLPQDERDTFWHLRVGKGTDDFLRIAKPHFLGATFASLPERLMQWGIQNDPEAFHDFLSSMVKHTMGPFGAPLQLAVSDKPFAERIAGAADLLGPAGKTALELATNHDFFKNRDIEQKWTRDPESGAYLPSYLRSDEYSSLVARTLAKSPLGRATGISPLQLDHAINNFTGSGGRLLVNAELDPIAHALGAGELPKQRSRKWGGLGYTENRYASEERLKRENRSLQDVAGAARAEERDLPPDQADRYEDVRAGMAELKSLRRELIHAEPDQVPELRRQIRELTAALKPPPGGKP